MAVTAAASSIWLRSQLLNVEFALASAHCQESNQKFYFEALYTETDVNSISIRSTYCRVVIYQGSSSVNRWLLNRLSETVQVQKPIDATFPALTICPNFNAAYKGEALAAS